VRPLDNQLFMVVFLDKNSLDTFTKFSRFEMSLFGLEGKLANSDLNP
jgi:hypothetical protein